jgi:hypothetical protein
VRRNESSSNTITWSKQLVPVPASFTVSRGSKSDHKKTTDDKQSRKGRNYVKRMVNEYQSAAEIIAEVPAGTFEIQPRYHAESPTLGRPSNLQRVSNSASSNIASIGRSRGFSVHGDRADNRTAERSFVVWINSQSRLTSWSDIQFLLALHWSCCCTNSSQDWYNWA